ncbi:TPA: restriction endonuclease subunit S [Enterococcus faecalis]
MMSKKSPQLRFEGFTDDWEERKLGDTETHFTDGNYGESYPSAKDMSDKANGIPFLRGSDFSNGYLDSSNANYIKPEKHAELTSGHIKQDDIVLAVRGSLGTLGYATQENEGWNINSQLAILRTKKSEISGMFLIQYLLGSKGQKEIFSRNTGTALKQLPIKQLKDIPVPVPTLLEQQKIGNFFKELDSTIALHQRKLDLLKEQKKGYLQKMFPKNGAKVPELRFAGFADDWEERKLEELALVLTGFPFKNEDFVDNGKYLVITNGNIQNESSTVDVSLGNRVDDLSDEIKERYYLNKNDILVTMDGTVGRTAKVVDDNMILAQRVARLVANKNTEFVYQWLNQGSFFNEMTKVSHGGTIKHISLNEISNYSATVPSNNIEQQKIGSFFKKIDDTIALHQRKLDLLKEQKKGFLQKMFV